MDHARSATDEQAAPQSGAAPEVVPPVAPPRDQDRFAAGGTASASLDRLALLQRAFLLGQLAPVGAEAKTSGQLNRQLGAVARRELQLSPSVANQVRRELAAQGYLEARKPGRNPSYALTDAGRAYLATLDQPQIGSRPGRTTPVDETAIPETLREAQKAYLLLQLLDAKERTLTQGEANRIPKPLVLSLGLKPAVANYRRARLAEQGYLRSDRNGRSLRLTLTPDGLDYLAASVRHLGHARFTLSGETLNTLIDAAKEASFERGPPVAAERAAPSAAELAEAVLAEFEDLRRERHGRSGLVPIHEVRQRLAAQFGPAAGRHDVLDEIILGLWRQRRIGLEAISDLTDATAQQLDESIPGVNETLFYLEVARAQPVTQ